MRRGGGLRALRVVLLFAAACSDSRSTQSSTHAGPDSGADSSTRPGTDSGTAIGSDGAPGSDAHTNPETGASPTGNTSSAASWFSSAMYFNQPVDTAALDPQSSTVINNLVANGGWGLGHIQVDFSIDVYYADGGSQQLPFSPTGVAMPDSDIPMTVPVDPNSVAGFESSSGKTCDGGDCHYLVVDSANSQLIEIYQAQASGPQFSASGGSVAIWSFTKPYRAALRGDVCTSADASGGLMAPLLFTAEEVAAGHIDHAIRFILPNSRIQNQEYVRPATHGTGGAIWATSGGVPYGARFRLKPSFDASMLSAGAQVVVAGLKKYGMILSDGGNVALTAKSDRVSTTKWTNLGSHDLETLVPGDFEMVEASYGTDAVTSSQRFDFTSYACTRIP